jgi:hypothetical protein
MTQIGEDRDTHDPTFCEECNNSGYVTQYIDGGRLIARVPCGCPQTEEPESIEDEELPKPTDWWVQQRSWEKEMRITYSRSVSIDIGVALLDSIKKWFKERHTKLGPTWSAYCRQRCREYMLAYRQHHRLDRREYL